MNLSTDLSICRQRNPLCPKIFLFWVELDMCRVGVASSFLFPRKCSGLFLNSYMKYDINQEDKKWLSEYLDQYKKFKKILTLPKHFSDREFFFLKIPLCNTRGDMLLYLFLERIRDSGNQKRPSTMPFVFIAGSGPYLLLLPIPFIPISFKIFTIQSKQSQPRSRAV